MEGEEVREQWAMQEPLPLKRPPGAVRGCYPTPESPSKGIGSPASATQTPQNHNTMSYAKASSRERGQESVPLPYRAGLAAGELFEVGGCVGEGVGVDGGFLADEGAGGPDVAEVVHDEGTVDRTVFQVEG